MNQTVVACAAAAVILLAVVSTAGKAGSAPSAPEPTANIVPAVLANPGLCAVNISAGLRAGGEVKKAREIDAACAAVETHRQTGIWPTDFGP